MSCLYTELRNDRLPLHISCPILHHQQSDRSNSLIIFLLLGIRLLKEQLEQNKQESHINLVVPQHDMVPGIQAFREEKGLHQAQPHPNHGSHVVELLQENGSATH